MKNQNRIARGGSTLTALAVALAVTGPAGAQAVFTPEIVGATVTRRSISFITDDLPANAEIHARARTTTGRVIFDRTFGSGQYAIPGQPIDWATNVTAFAWSMTEPSIVVIEVGVNINGAAVFPFRPVAVGAATCSPSGQQGSGFANTYPVVTTSTWLTPIIDDSGRLPERCEASAGWDPSAVAATAAALRCQAGGGLTECVLPSASLPPATAAPVTAPDYGGPVPAIVTQDGAPDQEPTVAAPGSRRRTKVVIAPVRPAGKSLGLKTVVRGPVSCPKGKIRFVRSDNTSVIRGQLTRVITRACVAR